MKIVFVVYAKPEVGLGHWFRTLALADVANEAGHQVWLCGNRMARGIHNYYQIRENEPDDLYFVIEQIKPDCLVLDLQDKVPGYVYNIPRKNMKIVVLNGVGREEEDQADLTIIQGFSDTQYSKTFSGVEYIILRPELFKYPKIENPKSWFVFGGAADKMQLLAEFQHTMWDIQANLWTTSFSPLNGVVNNDAHSLYRTDGYNIVNGTMFAIMCLSKAACISMGMTAWELVAMGIPTYVFSWSEGHLAFAKQMEKNGLIKVWDGIGLPGFDLFRNFLLENQFEITGDKPDEFGAQRVLKLMEE